MEGPLLLTLTRRQLLVAGVTAASAAAAGMVLGDQVWPLLARENFVPGRTPELVLPAAAWENSAERLVFAAVRATGTGGRQAVGVATSMARAYERQPYGLITHLGGICYYGDIEKRFDDVFLRPYGPLINAGVAVELAIGNHDGEVHYADERLERIDTELRLLGKPARYYRSTHGPLEFFYLDSSLPGLFGEGSSRQLEWLDDSLASSTSQWKVVCLHHPPHSSGWHGSTPGGQEVLVPLLERHAVDLVLAGHDHHYERTVPINGVTYVVSGGGAKLTPVRATAVTAAASSALQHLHVEVHDDRLTGRSFAPDGRLVHAFTLGAREGT